MRTEPMAAATSCVPVICPQVENGASPAAIAEQVRHFREEGMKLGVDPNTIRIIAMDPRGNQLYPIP